MLTYIISVACPAPLKGGIPDVTNYRHSKYVIRRRYVESTLLPQIQRIFGEAEIFNAITDEHFHVANGKASFWASEPPEPGDEPDLEFTIGDSGSMGNFMSHAAMWRACLSANKPVLVLEDDAELPADNAAYVLVAVAGYCKREDTGHVLYLQSQCPYRPNTIKDYALTRPLGPPGCGLIELPPTVNDMSGTVAYVIRPKAARALLDRGARLGHLATDAFMHRACAAGEIKFCLSEQHHRCFMLHDNLEPYNHVHDPNLAQYLHCGVEQPGSSLGS